MSVLELLSEHNARATLYLPTSNSLRSGHLGRSGNRLLSWAEIASLPDNLVEIGSHSTSTAHSTYSAKRTSTTRYG